tara:strand:- start:76 stop:309 length:234 start_codon:yes stop_codon:yes gene_type:complete
VNSLIDLVSYTFVLIHILIGREQESTSFLLPETEPFESFIPTELTAKYMGHSVGEHVITYLRYLGQKDVAEIAAILS